jgi:hypothetical protein
MSEDEEGAGEPQEAVGFKRPPKASQFKKGASGNPGGRPRRKTNFEIGANMDAELAELIRTEASRTVTVRENGRTEEISIKSAMLRRLYHAGLKGDVRSLVEALRINLAAERFTAEQKAGPSGLCPQCSEFAAMSDDELIEYLMEMQSTGRFKPPGGGVLVMCNDDDPDEDDPWGVG